jgi:hypothetical protein
MTSNEIPFNEYRHYDCMAYNDSPALYDYLRYIYETEKIFLYYIGGADRLAKIRDYNDELKKIRPEFDGYWCKNEHIEHKRFNTFASTFRGLDQAAYYFVKKDHPFSAFGKTFKSCNEVVKVITI